MRKKTDLISDEDLDRVRGQLQHYIRAQFPSARFRRIDAHNTDDLDTAVDIGAGERFVRVSFETALEVPELKVHLDSLKFLDALQAVSAKAQLVVATSGLYEQAVDLAFR